MNRLMQVAVCTRPIQIRNILCVTRVGKGRPCLKFVAKGFYTDYCWWPHNFLWLLFLQPLLWGKTTIPIVKCHVGATTILKRHG